MMQVFYGRVLRDIELSATEKQRRVLAIVDTNTALQAATRPIGGRNCAGVCYNDWTF